MKIIHHIKKLFPCAKASSAEGGPSVIVIDAESLLRGQDRGGQLTTQDKIAILKRLAVFVEKEKVAILAVLRGQPLRIAEDGGQFRGMTIRYTGNENGIVDFIAGILKKGKLGRVSVVITGNRDVERAVKAIGIPVMHPSTFKKAFEQDEPRPQPRPPERNHREKQDKPEPKQVDENEKIVQELIDPL